MNFNFKKYGDIEIIDVVHLMETFDWEDYTFRQDNFKSHTQTKTIPLIWDETKDKIIYWENYPLFKSLLTKLEVLFTTKIGEGVLSNAILVKMPKQTSIDRHKDDYVFFKRNNRIHIPLITNENCIFEVDGEEINMKAGEVWEINNFEKEHSVVNNGNNDRIHLIVDWQLIKNNKTLI
jgi:hypothetical protein